MSRIAWWKKYRGQSFLGFEGDNMVLKSPNEPASEADWRTLVRCAYCLYEAPMLHFRFMKDGRRYYLYKCPDCGTQQRLQTLMMLLDPMVYGRWVCQCSMSGSWKRFAFDKIKSRLKALGISTMFWDAYYAEKVMIPRAVVE